VILTLLINQQVDFISYNLGMFTNLFRHSKSTLACTFSEEYELRWSRISTQ
jgi:hypothetical protein